jgi:hypothetical protein
MQLAGKVDDEDVHGDARERIGCEASSGSAVDVYLCVAGSGEVKGRRFGDTVEVEMDAEMAGLVALGAGEILSVVGPDVLLRKRLVEGGEEDGILNGAGGVELAGRRERRHVLGE